MTFFTKYGPAHCDKNCHSEHQIANPLSAFRGGSGNETSIRVPVPESGTETKVKETGAGLESGRGSYNNRK